MLNIPPKRIVVGTDFSETATAALDYAIAIARPFGAEIVVVHAYEFPFYAFADTPMPGDILDRIATASKEALDGLVKVRSKSGIAMRGVLREGPAPREIAGVAETEKADLIVVGTHGRRGLSRIFLGSVAERVVRTAPCPVLTVGAKGGA